MRITVRCREDMGEFPHFWRSTGFTPAKRLLDCDMQQALAHVGGLPQGGIRHVRIHYLLDLVGAAGLGTGAPGYDWRRLDEGLDVLVRNGLKPFCELMGNPSGRFDDFRDNAQLHAWKDLVRELARHLMERYGREEVESWYFESWNEPDVGWWHQWPEDEQSHCNYYDACSEGLREANPNLTFGGPGTCRTLSSLFCNFLEHCDSGANYFTGKSGVRLDFVSVHEKGVRSCPEDLTPDSRGISEREGRIVRYIRDNHPRLADLPFMNNECDPQTGWGDIHTWRARPYYAAMVGKVIHQHLRLLIDGLDVNYGLLSNDNGFIGTWGNRTLVTRFGDENECEIIKKPVLNAMTLLAMLGGRRCAVSGPEEGGRVGALATRQGDQQVAVLVYNSADQITSSGSERISLSLTDLPFKEGMLTHYRIDAEHGNPFAVWEEHGAPRQPSPKVFAQMRLHSEPALYGRPRVVTTEGNRLPLVFELPRPGVSLFVLSARPERGPGRPAGLRAERYAGLTGEENLMLRWDGLPCRTLRTWEVLGGKSEEGPFERLNETEVLSTAWLHARPEGGERFYKVRAVDLWGRTGEPSPAVKT